MRVIVDSREQAPFPFRGPRYEGATVEVGTLSVGDYSLAGLADKVAVERCPIWWPVWDVSGNALNGSCNAGRLWMPLPWW